MHGIDLSSTAFELSPQQMQAWRTAIAQSHSNTSALLFTITDRKGDPVTASKIKQALTTIAERHEVLQTVYRRQLGMSVPFQFICKDAQPAFSDNSRSKRLEELFRDEIDFKWDLEEGPLLRCVVAEIDIRSVGVIISTPAISADYRSLQNIAAELLSTLASDPALPTSDMVQYVDFVQWQKEVLESSEAQVGRDFWRNMERKIVAENDQTLNLPFKQAKEPTGCIDAQSWAISHEDLIALRSVANSANVSTSTVLLSSWSLLISRLSGSRSTVVGFSHDGRTFSELSSCIGRYTKLLPAIVNIRPSDSFLQLLSAVKTVMADSSKWQDSFSCAIYEGSVRCPQFTFQHIDLGKKVDKGSFQLELLRSHVGGEPIQLRLVTEEGVSALRVELQFDSGLYRAEDIRNFLEQYRLVLESVLRDPKQFMAQLPLVSKRERERLVEEWNATGGEYPKKTMDVWIAEQAGKSPEAMAVRCLERTLSYGELNEQANRLAHYLRRQGVGRGSLVGLCVERSAEMMVGVLAILKAGGAYVPLSADHPPGRLVQQLAGAKALLTEAKYREQMSGFAGKIVLLDGDKDKWAAEAGTNPEAVTTAEDLVYVIYTSGSTGVPKGVAVRHRNLVNYTAHMVREFGFGEPQEEQLQFATVSTLGADLGNTAIYPALVSGGCVHVLPYEVATDAQRMGEYQAQYGVDVLKIVPSHLAALLDAGSEGKRVLPRKLLVLGGEALKPELVERIMSSGAGCEVVNHYGPTETTVGSLLLRLKDYEWKKKSGDADDPAGKTAGEHAGVCAGREPAVGAGGSDGGTVHRRGGSECGVCEPGREDGGTVLWRIPSIGESGCTGRGTWCAGCRRG